MEYIEFGRRVINYSGGRLHSVLQCRASQHLADLRAPFHVVQLPLSDVEAPCVSLHQSTEKQFVFVFAVFAVQWFHNNSTDSAPADCRKWT